MTTLQRLTDFFFVYYDAKTARKVERRPETAIPLLREDISAGLPTPERLQAYAAALRDAISLQGVATR